LFKRKKDVDGIMTGVSVRKVLTMFVQSSSSFYYLKERLGLPQVSQEVGVDQVAFKSS